MDQGRCVPNCMNLKLKIAKQRWRCWTYVSRDTAQEALKSNVRRIRKQLGVNQAMDYLPS